MTGSESKAKTLLPSVVKQLCGLAFRALLCSCCRCSPVSSVTAKVHASHIPTKEEVSIVFLPGSRGTLAKPGGDLNFFLLRGQLQTRPLLLKKSRRNKSGVAQKETSIPTEVSGLGKLYSWSRRSALEANTQTGSTFGLSTNPGGDFVFLPLASSMTSQSIQLASLKRTGAQEMKKGEKCHCSRPSNS